MLKLMGKKIFAILRWQFMFIYTYEDWSKKLTLEHFMLSWAKNRQVRELQLWENEVKTKMLIQQAFN